MPITGQVVEILDEYNVIVDVGYRHGVEDDMEFVIYTEGETIEHPETGEELGDLEFKKAKVKPSHIMENMTVMEASGVEIESYGVFNLPNLGPTTKKKELPVEDVSDIGQPDEEIQVGDLVREHLPDADPYTGEF